MARMYVELEWDDSLGLSWMNMDNLGLCLYSDEFTKKKLLKVKEIRPIIKYTVEKDEKIGE